LGPIAPRAGFDVAQALAVGQLRKGHGEELLPAGKLLGVAVAAVTSDTAAELAIRKKVNQLGENALAFIHPLSLSDRARGRHAFQIAASKMYL
jgi:uncharacterized protein (DUF697 family)